MKDQIKQTLDRPRMSLTKKPNTARRGMLHHAGLLGVLAVGISYGGTSAFAQGATTPGIAPPRSSAWALEIGKPAQLPKLELLNGRPWQLDDHRGKVVILEFWHSRCPFCMKQNPLLDAFFQEHRSKGLEVVTVTIDKKKSDAENYMQDHGYQFGAGLADETWHAIYKSRKGLPQLFVIDRKGILQAIELGEMFPDELAELTRFL